MKIAKGALSLEPSGDPEVLKKGNGSMKKQHPVVKSDIKKDSMMLGDRKSAKDLKLKTSLEDDTLPDIDTISQMLDDEFNWLDGLPIKDPGRQSTPKPQHQERESPKKIDLSLDDKIQKLRHKFVPAEDEPNITYRKHKNRKVPQDGDLVHMQQRQKYDTKSQQEVHVKQQDSKSKQEMHVKQHRHGEFLPSHRGDLQKKKLAERELAEVKRSEYKPNSKTGEAKHVNREATTSRHTNTNPKSGTSKSYNAKRAEMKISSAHHGSSLTTIGAKDGEGKPEVLGEEFSLEPLDLEDVQPIAADPFVSFEEAIKATDYNVHNHKKKSDGATSKSGKIRNMLHKIRLGRKGSEDKKPKKKKADRKLEKPSSSGQKELQPSLHIDVPKPNEQVN